MKITFSCITLQLSWLLLGVACRHIPQDAAVTPCPEGCTCTSDNTVVCDGLELEVVPVNFPTDSRHLSLHNNQLSQMPQQKFDEVAELQQSHNHNNELILQSKTASSLPQLDHLEITHNTLHCDCKLAWMQNWKEKDLDILINATRLTCASPATLQGESLQKALKRLNCWKDRHKRTGGHDGPHSNPCGSSPCQHGGMCIMDPVGFHCMCAAGYTGDYCEAWTSDRSLLQVNTSIITSTSICVIWRFPSDVRVRGFELTYQARTDPEMYMPYRQKLETHLRMYIIDGLLPNTVYEICVCAKPPSRQMNGVKTCLTESTIPNSDDELDKQFHPSGGENANFHHYGMVVFGVVIAVCAISIVAVALLYRRRVRALRNEHMTPTAPSPTRHTQTDTDPNDIDLAAAVPTNNLTTHVTDTTSNLQEPPSPPSAPPNTPILPSYEEATAMSGSTVNFYNVAQPPTGNPQAPVDNVIGLGNESTL